MALQHVGRPIKRIEDPRLVTGSDRYVNDVRAGRRPHPRLRPEPPRPRVIKGIDTSAARAVPGVVAVLTGAELNADVGVIHTPLPAEMFGSMNRQGYGMLAEGRVRHVGEPVAVVAAETAAAAVDGAEAVRVDYEPLPAVVDSEAALEPGAPAPLSRDGIEPRREHEDRDRRGRRGLQEGRRWWSRPSSLNQRVIPFAMEPRACSAVWDERAQKLTMWGDTQIPHRMRDQVAERHEAQARADPPDDRPRRRRLRRQGARVPGGHHRPACWRAGSSGRCAGRRRAARTSRPPATGATCAAISSSPPTRTGASSPSTRRIIGNAGYCLYHVGPLLPVLCAQMITGCYDIQIGARRRCWCRSPTPWARCRIAAPAGPRPPTSSSAAMDLLAAELGLDPAEVRRRNFIPPRPVPLRHAVRQLVRQRRVHARPRPRARPRGLRASSAASSSRRARQGPPRGHRARVLRRDLRLRGRRDLRRGGGRRRQGHRADGRRLARPGPRDGLRPARGRRAPGARSSWSPCPRRHRAGPERRRHLRQPLHRQGRHARAGQRRRRSASKAQQIAAGAPRGGGRRTSSTPTASSPCAACRTAR